MGPHKTNLATGWPGECCSASVSSSRPAFKSPVGPGCRPPRGGHPEVGVSEETGFHHFTAVCCVLPLTRGLGRFLLERTNAAMAVSWFPPHASARRGSPPRPGTQVPGGRGEPRLVPWPAFRGSPFRPRIGPVLRGALQGRPAVQKDHRMSMSVFCSEITYSTPTSERLFRSQLRTAVPRSHKDLSSPDSAPCSRCS